MNERLLKNVLLLPFLLLVLPSNAQELIRQPYLQTVWADSATIMWKTDASVKSCSVKYTYTKQKKVFFFFKKKVTKTITQKGNLNPHAGEMLNEVVLKNLDPDTKYQYEIYSNGKKLAGGKDYYFISSPEKNKERFSFYALGDIGAKKPQSFADKAANEIDKLAIRPDFGLGLGDIVYPKGESKVYDAHLFEPLKRSLKIFPFIQHWGITTG